jgi:hypothetical protein
MPWFKVDDAFHCHPKAMRAGTVALGLWARCGSWAAQQLTDGFVPTDVALMYGTKTQIKALVSAGLWSDVDGGYQFHDWSPINPTREQVLADREAAKERQRRARDAAESRRKSRVSHAVTDDEYQASSRSPQPNPTEGSKEPSKSRKRATPPPDIYPINDEMRTWAEEHTPSVMLVVETAKMLDWARGKGEKKADWLATWRNWMRRRQDEITAQSARSSSRFDSNGTYTAWDA